MKKLQNFSKEMTMSADIVALLLCITGSQIKIHKCNVSLT